MQMMYHDAPGGKGSNQHHQNFAVSNDARQLSSKRSYENTQNFENGNNKKGNRKTSKSNMQSN